VFLPAELPPHHPQAGAVDTVSTTRDVVSEIASGSGEVM